MSKALVEQLRELAASDTYCLGSYKTRCREAADRIEELDDEYSDLSHVANRMLARALKAEKERDTIQARIDELML